MSHIKVDAALHSVASGIDYFAGVIDDAGRISGEAMGDDIAGTQLFEVSLDGIYGSADVDHQRLAELT